MPEKNHLRTIAPVLVLGAAALIAFLAVNNRPVLEKHETAKILPSVWTESVSPKTITLTVITEGLVTPHRQIDLAAEVAGKITWISENLVAGGQFQQGDPMVKLEPRDFELRLNQASAEKMRAGVELEIAEKDYQRQKDLHRQKLSSATQLDDAFKSFKLAEAADLSAAANLEQARLQIARTQIDAPFTGRVQSESVDVGGYIKVGSPIANIYADDIVEVRLPVSNSDMRYLTWPADMRGVLDESHAAPVIIKSSYGGIDFAWQGRLVRVESEIDTATRLFYAVAEVVNPTGLQTPPLAVGLFVKAEIQGLTLDNIIELPREAIRENNQVIVIDDDNRIFLRDVSVLRTEYDRVLIDGGLERGERVCTSPMQVVVEGMQVTPLSRTGTARTADINNA